MSISANTKEVLLWNLFYSVGAQFTSIKSLYDQVKNKGITYDEVRDFIQKQESSQLFKRKKRISHYFPITANFRFEILQIDLVDMSNIASANKNYKYLLVAIDVFSRYAFVYPLKSKSAEYISEVMNELVEETSPIIINTDLGSEFISSEFKKIMERQAIEINYIGVHEHKKIGIVDRFVKTLRQKINMYLTQYNTSKYIDVLQKIVDNYNNNYHTGIKKIPAEVTNTDTHIKRINIQKINKASKEEDIYNVGQKVRYIKNRETFTKGTLPSWSKTVHTIVSSSSHSYTLDNGIVRKYYEIQPITVVQKLNKLQEGPSREEMKKDKGIQRKLRSENINLENISNEKRNRKPTDRYKS